MSKNLNQNKQKTLDAIIRITNALDIIKNLIANLNLLDKQALGHQFTPLSHNNTKYCLIVISLQLQFKIIHDLVDDLKMNYGIRLIKAAEYSFQIILGMTAFLLSLEDNRNIEADLMQVKLDPRYYSLFTKEFSIFLKDLEKDLEDFKNNL